MHSSVSLRPRDEQVLYNTSAHYTRLMGELAEEFSGVAIETSFRRLVGVLPADESTHGIYPYPARLLRHIPRMLLASGQVVAGVEYLIDPFCGSGTILLEAQERGIPSLGIDQNPVAALISRVKTSPLEVHLMDDYLSTTLQNAKRKRSYNIPAEYLRRWYEPPVLSGLARLMGEVSTVEDPAYRDFLSVVLANAARKLSHADPRIPVPVRRRPFAPNSESTKDVWDTWLKVGKRTAEKLARLRPSVARAQVVRGDARNMTSWRNRHLGKPSLVITSPPYGAAQKYIRSTSLEAGWLGFTEGSGTIALERDSIGREHLSSSELLVDVEKLQNQSLQALLRDVGEEHPVRASIYINYFLDMQRVFEQCASDEVNCRRLVLICGTNVVRGRLLETHDILAKIAAGFGFRRTLSLRDPIRGRSLLTTRKFDGAPAPAEYVEIFER